MVNRGVGGEENEWASTASFWEWNEKQERELNSSSERAVDSDEFLQSQRDQSLPRGSKRVKG